MASSSRAGPVEGEKSISPCCAPARRKKNFYNAINLISAQQQALLAIFLPTRTFAALFRFIFPPLASHRQSPSCSCIMEMFFSLCQPQTLPFCCYLIEASSRKRSGPRWSFIAFSACSEIRLKKWYVPFWILPVRSRFERSSRLLLVHHLRLMNVFRAIKIFFRRPREIFHGRMNTEKAQRRQHIAKCVTLRRSETCFGVSSWSPPSRL